MKLGEIINKYRLENKLSMQDFADMSGISKAYIGFLEKGYNPSNNKPIAPSISTIQKIAMAMHMDFDKLFSMIDGNVTVNENVNDINIHYATRIPVLGYVAAGIPIDAIQEILDWEEIPTAMAETGKFFGLRIKGDSMEPRICEGDTVIVKAQSTADSGDTVIVQVNGNEATCKKLKITETGISLISLNAVKYDPMEFTKAQIKELPVTIIGRVVELRGKF